MNIEQKTKSIFHKCVEDILIYCLTHPIKYMYTRHDDKELQPTSLLELVEIYTRRFVQTFAENKTVILGEEEGYLVSIDEDFIRHIDIVGNMRYEYQECIINKLKTSLDQIRHLYSKDDMYSGMGVGICCYCEGDCNPQSQACGPCMRGNRPF